MILTKRVWQPASPADGKRFLVDGLWPRGLRRQAQAAEAWLPAVAPSATLRRWFGHDPKKWAEFKARYFAELKAKPEAWAPLLQAAREGPITLLYASRHANNNAQALKEFLEQRLAEESASP
jgi:uncharacterized protein YeaO (DUF488 family)